MRRDFLKLMLCAGVAALPLTRAHARQRFKQVPDEIAMLVEMKASPFPFHGENPDTGEPFMKMLEGHRLGHQSPRGGIRWEDETYSDKRALFDIPKGFDLSRPAVLIVYFHGNDTTLERDVMGRQHIPAQLAQSGINAVLVAPQFAFDARDSSPGNFWRPGYFSGWLAEAASHLAKLHGGGAKASDFNHLPVVLVAYSGGYLPAAWSLKQGGTGHRIEGVILMDALYGDAEKFANWIAMRRKHVFLFSAYSKSSRQWNLELQELLVAKGIDFARGFPDALAPGQIHFGEAPQDLDHVEFMSLAWTPDPLSWVLQRIAKYRL